MPRPPPPPAPRPQAGVRGRSGPAVAQQRDGVVQQGTALGLTAVLADRSFVTEPAPKLQALSGELEAVLAPGAGEGALGENGVYDGDSVTIRPQLLRIGSVSMASLPFECLAEMSLAMKAKDPNSFLVSVAGGYEGYIPLEHEFGRGGYEVEIRSTYFVPGTADALLEMVLGWLGDGLAASAEVESVAQARL